MPTALRDYELVFILSPDLTDDVVDSSIERVTQAITSRGGEIVDVNHWGRRRMAYPIKRHLEGNYVVTQIKLEPGQVSDLEGTLRISEEVIRHMIVQANPEAAAPPPPAAPPQPVSAPPTAAVAPAAPEPPVPPASEPSEPEIS